MPQYRPDRVAELVHGELARLLREDVSDPRLVALSVTAVRMTPDLKQARVRVLPLGGEGDRQNLLDGLSAASGYLRTRLGRNLRLRFAPALQFKLDDNLAEAARITELLRTLTEQEGGEE